MPYDNASKIVYAFFQESNRYEFLLIKVNFYWQEALEKTWRYNTKQPRVSKSETLLKWASL